MKLTNSKGPDLLARFITFVVNKIIFIIIVLVILYIVFMSPEWIKDGIDYVYDMIFEEVPSYWE